MQTEDKILKFQPAIDRPLTEPDFDTKQYLIARKDRFGLKFKELWLFLQKPVVVGSNK